MNWFRNALAVALLSTGLCSQITPFGYDENPSGSLFIAGDPPPQPKLGTVLNFEWYYDLFYNGWSGLVMGPDTPVRANLCWFSEDPHDMLNRWLLLAPIWHTGKQYSGMGWWYHSVPIPSDPALVGCTIKVQAFYQADKGWGGTPCSRLRATNGLRIKFMYN